MATFGERLRNKREQLGYSSQMMADDLTIPLDVIDAMEAQDCTRLPQPVFTKGFLRTYCATLNLEAESIVAEYEIELARTKSRAYQSNSPTISVQLPRMRLPQWSVPVSTDCIAWLSITALVLFGWFTYSSVVPSTSNVTEATSIDRPLTEPIASFDF